MKGCGISSRSFPAVIIFVLVVYHSMLGWWNSKTGNPNPPFFYPYLYMYIVYLLSLIFFCLHFFPLPTIHHTGPFLLVFTSLQFFCPRVFVSTNCYCTLHNRSICTSITLSQSSLTKGVEESKGKKELKLRSNWIFVAVGIERPFPGT